MRRQGAVPRRRLLAIGVVSTIAAKEPAATSIPGTISSSLPQPPRTSGVAPINVTDKPIAIPNTATALINQGRAVPDERADGEDTAVDGAVGGWCFRRLEVTGPVSLLPIFCVRNVR